MSAQRLYTWADLAEFPEEMRTELFAGELVVTPSPFARHQQLSGRLFVAIANHLDTAGGGEAFYELDIVFDDRNVCRPDLLVVTDDQREIIKGHVYGAPKLVIEVLSDPRRDRVRKRATYARFGVTEYWIVDHDADRVEVHRLVDGTYDKPTLLEPGDLLTTPILPGLEIDLTALFRP